MEQRNKESWAVIPITLILLSVVLRDSFSSDCRCWRVYRKRAKPTPDYVKDGEFVGIDVSIILGRGPFLFNGSVPEDVEDQAEYECAFCFCRIFRIRRKEECRFEVCIKLGFCWRTTTSLTLLKSRKTGFSITPWQRQGTRRQLSSCRICSPGNRRTDRENLARLSTWHMRFAPKENKTLTVQYQIPMSMGSGRTHS